MAVMNAMTAMTVIYLIDVINVINVIHVITAITVITVILTRTIILITVVPYYCHIGTTHLLIRKKMKTIS